MVSQPLDLATKRRVRGRKDAIARVPDDVRARGRIVADEDLAGRRRDGEGEAAAVLRLAVEEAQRHVRVGGDRELVAGRARDVVGLVVAGLGHCVRVGPPGVGRRPYPHVDGVVGVGDVDGVGARFARVEVGVVVEGEEVQLEVYGRAINGIWFSRSTLVQTADVVCCADIDRLGTLE